MCGRIALFTPPARLARYFDAQLDGDVDRGGEPVWNVGPTVDIPGVRIRRRPETEPFRILQLFRWGLVPSFAQDLRSGSRLFNARAETVATKSTFRAAFRSRRAIIPVDGFYEWGNSGGRRQPYFFTRTDGAPLALAGLWESWRDRSRAEDPDAWVRSCTIVTTGAGPDLDGIHDRMPVVLDPTAFDVWLDPEDADVDELEALLVPAPAGTLSHHPVDPRVGNVAHDSPDLVAPYDPAGATTPTTTARQPELPL